MALEGMSLSWLMRPAFYLLHLGWKWIGRNKRKLSTPDIIASRNKWKAEIEPRIQEHRAKKIGLDVIVRDMKRVDAYPEIDDKARRISPWFKAGLVGTYHRGVLLLLNWYDLVEEGDSGWRRAEKGESGLRVGLIGKVRYENIESIDWDGDEYYYQPHIYCYFSERNREPYEEIVYAEERKLNQSVYYSEVANYRQVRNLSRRHARRAKLKAVFSGLCLKG